MAGGKAAVEAGAVTHVAVRCSAWLGVIGVASMRVNKWRTLATDPNCVVGSSNGVDSVEDEPQWNSFFGCVESPVDALEEIMCGAGTKALGDIER